jgi:hypothetical protein
MPEYYYYSKQHNNFLMKKFLLILFILILGCKEEYSEKLVELQKPPAYSIQSSKQFTLQPEDTLNISLPEGIPNYLGLTNAIHQDSLYYFAYKKHKIAKVNLVTEILDTINIPEKLVSGNLRSVCRLASDTLLLAQDYPAKLFLITGTKITQITLPKIDFNTSNEAFNRKSKSLLEDEVNFLVDFKNLVYEADKKLLHIGLQPVDAFYAEGFENSERIAVFSLEDREWKYSYAPPEGMLRYRGNKTYGYEMSQKYIFLKRDTVFVNYWNDHYIYYYRNGEYLGKFPHSGKQAKDLFLPFDLEAMNDAENLKMFKYAAPKYSGFFYHDKLKLYSRLYFDQQDPIDESGKYKPGDLLRDVYAIFLDENFEYVGEYKFPIGTIAFTGVEPLSDGFLIFDINATDQSKYGLKFRYKIVPVAQ